MALAFLLFSTRGTIRHVLWQNLHHLKTPALMLSGTGLILLKACEENLKTKSLGCSKAVTTLLRPMNSNSNLFNGCVLWNTLKKHSTWIASLFSLSEDLKTRVPALII